MTNGGRALKKVVQYLEINFKRTLPQSKAISENEWKIV